MFKENNQSPNIWMSFADLLTGALIVFMLITVVLVVKTRATYIKVEETQEEVTKQFSSKLNNIAGINVYGNGTIRFTSYKKKKNEQLFEFDSPNLTSSFKDKLDIALPVFFNEIYTIYETQKEEKITVKEIRIEGHSDSRGTDDHNLELSQQRATETWYYIRAFIKNEYSDRGFYYYVNKNIVTVGFGENRLLNTSGAIVDKFGGDENTKLSRRVELSVLLENIDDEN